MIEQCLAAGLFYALVTVNGLPFGEFCYKDAAALPVAAIASSLGNRPDAACPKTGTDIDLSSCLADAHVKLLPDAYRLVIRTTVTP